MAKVKIGDRLSLKTQFIVTFIIIILLSVVATIATIGIYFFSGFSNPSNYYEKKVSEGEKYIRENDDQILSKKNKYKLDKYFSENEIQYQVMNNNGEYIYGDLKKRLINNRKSFITMINGSSYLTNKIFEAKIIKYVPIIDKKSNLKGAVAIMYSIKSTTSNSKYQVIYKYVGIIIFLSPFIYFIIFTGIFAARLNKRIKSPIDEIIRASNKIKNKDLDFDINYRGNNELGQLSDAFRDMKAELKESLYNEWKLEEDRKEMIKAIAHDMKTPITVIQGHVEVLMDSGFENKERFTRYLNIIKNNTDRMAKLVSEINRASEIERQGFELDFEYIDIEEFLDYKNGNYEMLTVNNKINFKMDVKDTREDKVPMKIDAYRVEEILDNIISNSIRFTPEGKGIYMNTFISNMTIKFIIEDEGCGFSKKDLPHIFEKFYKGDTSRSKHKGNSGLGLYIAKILTEKHNGYIKVENTEVGGARITIIIKEMC